MSIPKNIYVLPRSNSDFFMFMFSKKQIDYNVGKNENLSKQQIELITNNLKFNIGKGALEAFKINGLNIIKHSYTVNTLRTTMYYIYDQNEVLIFYSIISGEIDTWLKAEEKILNSFQRTKEDSRKMAHGLFDLKFYTNENTEFSYGKDVINENPQLFNQFDKIADKANIKEYINSKQLSNSAHIYSKKYGTLFVVARDNQNIDFSNSELANDIEAIRVAKEIVDDTYDNNIPKNIEIIQSKKAEKYVSKRGLIFIIKEVLAKKTDLLSGRIKYNTSVFIEIFHNKKWYTMTGSYQNEFEKEFIYQIINDIEIK